MTRDEALQSIVDRCLTHVGGSLMAIQDIAAVRLGKLRQLVPNELILGRSTDLLQSVAASHAIDHAVIEHVPIHAIVEELRGNWDAEQMEVDARNRVLDAMRGELCRRTTRSSK